MLLPVPGKIGVFKDSESGQEFTIREQEVFEKSFQLHWGDSFPKGYECLKTDRIEVPQNEKIVVKRWAVILNPFPSAIPPTISVSLYINLVETASVTLRSIAEPPERVQPELEELERRIDAIEEAVGLRENKGKQAQKLFGQILLSKHETVIQVAGLKREVRELFPPEDPAAYIVLGGFRLWPARER
jgi:hypothetical protein